MGRIAVMGAGSWGTAFGMMCADAGQPTTIWSRRPEVAEEINEEHTNSTYLAGCALPPKLTATDDIEKAVGEADIHHKTFVAFQQFRSLPGRQFSAGR